MLVLKGALQPICWCHVSLFAGCCVCCLFQSFSDVSRSCNTWSSTAVCWCERALQYVGVHFLLRYLLNLQTIDNRKLLFGVTNVHCCRLELHQSRGKKACRFFKKRDRIGANPLISILNAAYTRLKDEAVLSSLTTVEPTFSQGF